MKSIIYACIALFICGFIAMGFSNKTTTQTILLQTSDSNFSTAALMQSADIISMRLKSFSTEKSEVTTLPEKRQIRVILTNPADLKITANLITQKGMLEFYETFDYQSLNVLIQNDSILTKLIHSKTPKDPRVILESTSAAEMQRMQRVLEAAGPQQTFKFAWANMFDDSDKCLYALKTDKVNLIPLSSADIQSFEAKYDSIRQKDFVEFKFKETAIQSWADITKRNIGKAIAMVLDKHVIFAPVVVSEINGGDCQISGDFTRTQVRCIAAIGAYGVLPLSFVIVK